MRRPFWRSAAFTGIALSIFASATLGAESTEEDLLLVMLQGQNLQAIKDSVTTHGALITHELPIINAIGASMTATQLDAVKRDTPGLERVIDDLAWTPDRESPSPEDDKQCPLTSGLELHWQSSAASWVIHNKGNETLQLTEGTISWPGILGALTEANIDSAGHAPLHVVQAGPNEASWGRQEGLHLPPHSKLTLQFVFSRAPADPASIQAQIKLSVRRDENCETKLIPGYAEPDEDSYYPTVSGAALLHSHGITGDGVTVAILDSGLWESHPELALDTRGEPRVLARYDAIKGTEVDEAFDESGHGTHMTSVMARSAATTRKDASQPSYRGIAPDADIVVVKAFGKSGEAGFLDIVRGVQWIVDHRERFNIRVLNLSFAARPRWPYWEDPVNQALMRAWRAGIFITAAAGNEGPEPMTVGSPGNLPYLLTVGAATDSWTESDTRDDYIPDFSSRGPTPTGHIKPDLVAMGGHMAGIIRPGSSIARDLPEYDVSSGDFVMTGTSQATALVSGLAALLLQIEPDLENNELKCMLVSSAKPAIEEDGRYAYSPFTQGAGLIDLQRALTIGDRDCEQAGLNLEAEISNRDHFAGPAIFNEGADPTLPGQSQIISDRRSEKGYSPSRRWGVAEHLQRLQEKPSGAVIDWPAIYAEEQRRISNLATQSP
jgi:hypothetical protein